MATQLEEIAPDIYTTCTDLKVFGLVQLNTRMTVVRLQNGDLWLHSPITPTTELLQQVAQLGTVKWLVSPNLFHHMFIEPWTKYFPEAQVLGSKGLSKKQPNLDILHVQEESQKFDSEIQCIPIKGIPALKEHVFYHRATKTLIITDILFYNPDVFGFTKGYFWLNRTLKEPNVPLLVKASIKDKNAFLDSLKELGALDVAQISMCHHYILKDNAKKHLDRVIQSFV